MTQNDFEKIITEHQNEIELIEFDNLPKSTNKDLTHKIFQELYVLGKSKQRKNRKICWWCICSCGNIKEYRVDSLSSGNSTNCGHNKKKICSELGKKYGYINGTKNKIEETIGTKYGNFIIIGEAPSQNNYAYWEVECQCKYKTHMNVMAANLRSGHSNHCPFCGFNSKGELKISEILIKNNISYEFQKSFDTCRFPKSNSLAKFDFYIQNKYLIEFDGKQHFESVEYFGGKEALLERQEKDKIKNQWCKDNNIPLIRIPYAHLKELKLEDLLLETSSYIIQENKNDT